MENEDIETEWSLALKKYGIIKDDKKGNKNSSQEEIIYTTTERKPVDVLDDDEALDEIRRRRRQQYMKYQELPKFGSVIEITAAEYVEEVNKAPQNVWVLLHLYQTFIPKCRFINASMDIMAQKYPTIKFIRSIATKCIQDYPDSFVPTLFIYKNSELIFKYAGPHHFGKPDAPYTNEDLLKILTHHKMLPKISDEDNEQSEDTEPSRLRCNLASQIYQNY